MPKRPRVTITISETADAQTQHAENNLNTPIKQIRQGHKQHRVQLGAIKEPLKTQTCAPGLLIS